MPSAQDGKAVEPAGCVGPGRDQGAHQSQNERCRHADGQDADNTEVIGIIPQGGEDSTPVVQIRQRRRIVAAAQPHIVGSQGSGRYAQHPGLDRCVVLIIDDQPHTVPGIGRRIGESGDIIDRGQGDKVRMQAVAAINWQIELRALLQVQSLPGSGVGQGVDHFVTDAVRAMRTELPGEAGERLR
jgi:hypothetical protein